MSMRAQQRMQRKHVDSESNSDLMYVSVTQQQLQIDILFCFRFERESNCGLTSF